MKAVLQELVPTEPFRLAYDCTLMRPACVLVAAAMAADSRVPHLFPAGSWLTHKTPDMQVYETTPEQLLFVIDKTARNMETNK
jgi:hypothetical protein